MSEMIVEHIEQLTETPQRMGLMADGFGEAFGLLPTFGMNQVDSTTFQIIDLASGTEMCVVAEYPEEPMSAKDRAEFVLSALHHERAKQQKQCGRL